MNPIMLIISEALYRPVYNIIVVFLEIFQGNLWWAIIFMTLVVRLILIKPSLKGTEMQKSMGWLQPKMQEIQEKYKDDPEKLSSEMMSLLKKEWGGPLKGCLGMLIQIPVFIWLFFVIRRIAADTIPTERLYSFLYSFGQPFVSLENMNVDFYGSNLLATGNVLITALAAIFTYLQMKLTTLVKPQTPKVPWANTPDMWKMMWFMNVFLVVIMASFVYNTATAIWLYILTTAFFSVLQYAIQYRLLLVAKLRTLFPKK